MSTVNGLRLSALFLMFLVLFTGCNQVPTALDKPSNAESAGRPVTRTYYIAADEVEWDFAPSGINQITGQPFGPTENVFVQNGPNRIGRKYIMARYREYTDATFTTLKDIPPAWQHLGVLGPVIRGVVDDSIYVYFKNNCTRPYSLHAHGLQYQKDSEGAPYDDGSAPGTKLEDAVPPGGLAIQRYFVAQRSGPASHDGTSVMWMYHSHVDEPADTNGGLIGPIIVTARAFARPDGTPKDVDREFVNMFAVLDQNISPYLQRNIDTYCGDPGTTDPSDEEFEESNLMHSINGYVYGNLQGLVMHRGERVRWYLMGMGTEVDLHTPHWHGATVTIMGMRTDVALLLPATMVVADMVPDVVGTWLYHCHVNDHIIAGMMAKFTVNP